MILCMVIVSCIVIRPIWGWCQPWGAKRAVTVVVAPVVKGELESMLYLVGTAYPLISTTISAQVAGNIESFDVNEGECIKEKSVICRLDKTLKLIEIKRTKSLLEQVRMELVKLEAGSREEEINRTQAQVANRKSIVEKLKVNKNRMENLFSKGMSTLEEKQNAYWDYQQGLAQLDEAQALHNLTVEGARKEDIMVVKARIATRRIELEKAEDDLSKTDITAPFKGVIVKKHKELGEWVKEGEAIAEIINIEKILVHTGISEKDVAKIKLGQSAEIIFDAHPDRMLRGKVKEIIPQADTQSRTFPIKIEVDNEKHEFYTGMFARIKLFIGENKQGLLVPKDALIKTGSVYHLFVVKDSTARRVKVKIGREKGDSVEVKGKIKVGDKVVVTNNEALSDKTKVNVVSGR